MSSPAQEAVAIVQEASGDGPFDYERYETEYRRILAERQKKLVFAAKQTHRAMDGWNAIKDADDWVATVTQTDEDLDTGKFLVDRLGGERFLEPAVVAALLSLRRRLVHEHAVTDAAGLMLVDLALISYFHVLRVNGWIGNLAIHLEHESFSLESPTAKLRKQYGSQAVEGLRIEDVYQRLSEQLMPVLDRLNRMLVRNLKALRDRKAPMGPSVTIGNAGQVNVANQQVNQITSRSRGRKDSVS
jgi:hypothetical protein